MVDPLISAIRVAGLFGLYSYSLPESGALSNATILYGDNGVGKSTVLRLAFHLLSAANNRGHRTALFDSYFSRLEVDLFNGVKLVATRNIVSESAGDGVADKLSLGIMFDGKYLAFWDHSPKGHSSESALGMNFDFEVVDDRIVSVPRKKIKLPVPIELYGEEVYMRVLSSVIPTTFLLSADRRLDSDSVSDPSDEVELRRLMRYEEPVRMHDLVVRTRQVALSQAVSSAARWISKKAVRSANQGSENVHNAYSQVLKHLVSTRSKTEEAIDTDALIRNLTDIEVKTVSLNKYEFATPLQVQDFKRALSSRSLPKRTMAAGFIKPYVDSVLGRLAAVESIYNLVDKFVMTVNDLLSDKKISYKVSQGFSVHNSRGASLEWSALSSGEQQLLLLFCYVLTGRDKPCVFMIDEPEISLNVKWQRQLIKSLLEITKGAEIQFIFASHSIELLAQHRDRVVKLVNSND